MQDTISKRIESPVLTEHLVAPVQDALPTEL